MKDQHLAPPRLLLACGEAPLGRILSHTLSSLGAEVECVHSHKALVGRILRGEYDIIITRFTEPLLESRRVVALLRGSYALHPTRRVLYVIADSLTAEESVALLERGVSQLFATPISTTRLGQKVSYELTKHRERCKCAL
ncbi:MAG: hypothetical protein J6U53_04030 [Tidjanibacter sp.]|nr:hypothetical protein [Tidjanibacter sp.]